MSRDSVFYISIWLKGKGDGFPVPHGFSFRMLCIGLRVISHKYIKILAKSAALGYRKIDFDIPFLFINHRPVRYIKLIPILI